MNVHQFLTSYSYGDAIGNEALEIRDFLRAQGIDSEIFTLHLSPALRPSGAQLSRIRPLLRRRQHGHFPFFHRLAGDQEIPAPGRPQGHHLPQHHALTIFSWIIHRILAKDCFKGRLELKSLADQVDLALGDSEYNRRELVEAGFRRTGVLPLVMDFSKFDLPVLPVFRELFADGKTNLLYIGRIIPNKKIEDVIRVFHHYQRYFNPTRGCSSSANTAASSAIWRPCRG